MILLLALILAAALILASFVQLLYLESMRLRTRELESLQFFKDRLMDALGYETEPGALVFSLIKHTLLVFTGAALVASGMIVEPSWVGVAEGSALAWLVMLVASYLIPQMLYRRSSGQWVLPLVPLIRFAALLFLPLMKLLDFLQRLSDLSEPQVDENKAATQAEEIEALINAGEEEGIIEKEDSRLIQNVVAFGDKSVRQVMTPRPGIVAIEKNRSLDDLRQLAKNEQYSRIPVFDGVLDRIVGFVHVRDLFELDEEHREGRTVESLMRKIEGVPESKPVADLLREMQRSGTHMVYVADEYGNLAGLVTLEDMVEEVFGEIRDEHEPPHDVQRSEDGSIVVSGSFDIDHLADHFGYQKDEDLESTTVGGLATEWCGAVPKSGTVIERQGLRLTVLASDDRRVDRVRIQRVAPAGNTDVGK
jgi:CBS domain containing-hemolysin-like protein